MNCYYVFSQHNCENKNDPWWTFSYYYLPIYRSCGELFPVTKEVPSTIPGNIYTAELSRKSFVTVLC